MGSPPLRSIGLAMELGVEERLLRLGFRSDVDVVLGAVDAVAVPSTRPEPLGLVALEAAAAGRPVVAAAHGGVAEVVRDGHTGRLVPPGEAHALAAALRALADDPAAAERMGRAGRADVAERFRLDRMLERIEATYDRLAERALGSSRGGGFGAFAPRGGQSLHTSGGGSAQARSATTTRRSIR